MIVQVYYNTDLRVSSIKALGGLYHYLIKYFKHIRSLSLILNNRNKYHFHDSHTK